MAQRAHRVPVHKASKQPVQAAQFDLKTDVGYQSYEILRLGFAAAPIIAGADKFFNLLTDWDQYLAPVVPRVTGIPTRTFMNIVGGIEIAAGVGVAVKPKYFSYVASAWLAGIVVNLLFLRRYYDIALRDVGLCLGALALARLSSHYER